MLLGLPEHRNRNLERENTEEPGIALFPQLALLSTVVKCYNAADFHSAANTTTVPRGVMAMRVNRNFSPEVARKLETVEEALLLLFLTNTNQEPIDLSPEDLAEITQARRELKAGKGVLHEEVGKWLDSWGDDNKRPPPQ